MEAERIKPPVAGRGLKARSSSVCGAERLVPCIGYAVSIILCQGME
jgi:hypothetical protein